MLLAIGGLLTFVGGLILLVGWIWMVVIMFQHSVVWGLLGLFLFLPVLIFGFMHFGKSKTPLFLTLGGLGAELLGTILFVAGAASVIASDPDLKKALDEAVKKQEEIMKKNMSPKK
jgi:hypothetical protein